MRDRFLMPIIVAVVMLFQIVAVDPLAARPAYRLGVHYDLVDSPQRLFARSADKVEVVEVFWYGCRSCYAIQRTLADWRGKQGQDIEFHRLPAVTSEAMMPMARAFFAARELGIAEQTHVPLFTALHAFRQHLDNERALADFFAGQGVQRADFFRAWRSSRVADGLRRARIIGKRYGLRGVPSLVVNGRYRVDASQASGAEQLIDILDYLVALEKTSPAR